MSAKNLIIDAEFRDLLRKLTVEESEDLERALIHDGCRDPLVVWNGILIDGHNRYEICKRNGLVFKTKEITSASRDTVKLWVLANQRARRNQTPNEIKHNLGLRYALEKKIQGPKKVERGQIGPFQKTAERMAKEEGLAPNTVKRAANFALGVEALELEQPGIKEEILIGKSKLTSAQVEEKGREKKRERAGKASPTPEEMAERENKEDKRQMTHFFEEKCALLNAGLCAKLAASQIDVELGKYKNDPKRKLTPGRLRSAAAWLMAVADAWENL